MLEGAQRFQVDDWLRQADKLIRAGRYLAADELLQKVFAIQPHNETAAAYQDRIHFLVRQLSQRVGLNSGTQAEIRKFMELLNSRKTNQVNALLMKSKKLLEEGQLKRASDMVSRVIALDPVNTYAAALLHRVNELLHQPPQSIEKEQEMQFRSLLIDAWHEGQPVPEMQKLIEESQTKLNISHGKRAELQREVKNQLYKDSLRDIWLTGGLSAFDMDIVETLRAKFEISRIDHALIESLLLREVRKNRVRGNVLLVDSDDATLLAVSQILRSNYYAVIAAGSFGEALAAVKTVTPDLILSEVVFADGSLGFDLFGFIRSAAETKHTPFLFMTSSLDRTTHLIGKRVGVDDFLVKPVDGELLVATITGLLLKKLPPAPPAKKK